MGSRSIRGRILGALSAGAFAGALHRVERSRYLADAPSADGSHVFVAGLPGDGKAPLLRAIEATGKFAYIDMNNRDLALVPNLASGKVSPTAGVGNADEAYWRLADAPGDALAGRRVPPEVMPGYVDLMRLVMRAGGANRYLSANDAHLLRLATVARGLARSTFLLTLCDPFRQGHRSLSAGSYTGSPDDWLRHWMATYKAVLPIESQLSNVAFVPQEMLATDPVVWRMIARRIEVQAGPADFAVGLAPGDLPAQDKALADEARALHAHLMERARLKLLS